METHAARSAFKRRESTVPLGLLNFASRIPALGFAPCGANYGGRSAALKKPQISARSRLRRRWSNGGTRGPHYRPRAVVDFVAAALLSGGPPLGPLSALRGIARDSKYSAQKRRRKKQLSNRQWSRVEHDPSHCKQRTASQSTRHKNKSLDSGYSCRAEAAALHNLLRFGYSASPMLDLGFVREHMDVIEKMARDRGLKLDLGPFVEVDTERRKLITVTEQMKAERNKANDIIGPLQKAIRDLEAKGQDVTDRIEQRDKLLRQMKESSDKIKRSDELVAKMDDALREFLLTIPNIPHTSVPVGKSAADNVEVRRSGEPPKFDFAPRPHWELGERAGILDFESAVKIAGARFAVYKGLGARLERAIANFFLDVHTREHGYTEILPPFIVNTAALTGVGQLPKFAADMFHLEGTDLWLTPTSEVELTNLYRDETIDADELPIKVCAWTACFRSEAGAAGKDTRGIKRQHQFQKVELFKFTRPEKSYDELETLVRNAEKMLERLGLHYRVMQLCTADMGFASAKTYDIEVWLPSAGEFMEISSCSNTEAFQARRSGIRFKPKGGKSEFVHTLNGSGLAVGRTWIAIVENFQQADGSIAIPEALVPYMGVEKIKPKD